jgi:hypothetical protein
VVASVSAAWGDEQHEKETDAVDDELLDGQTQKDTDGIIYTDELACQTGRQCRSITSWRPIATMNERPTTANPFVCRI